MPSIYTDLIASQVIEVGDALRSVGIDERNAALLRMAREIRGVDA